MKTKKGSIESSILEVWKTAAEQTEAERLHMQSYEVGTDRYANYTKNLTPGQEVTQKLDEKGLPPWLDKDKKKDDDKDEEKSVKKEGMPPWLKKGKKDDDDDEKKVDETNKNDKSDDGEGMDAVQPKAVKKKFKDRKDKDIDNDGDTDDSDEYLHKRRKAIAKNTKESWQEAVKKVAEYSKDKQEDDEVKGKKTMTGGKKADVQINPDIEKEEHKKKHVKAGYSY